MSQELRNDPAKKIFYDKIQRLGSKKHGVSLRFLEIAFKRLFGRSNTTVRNWLREVPAQISVKKGRVHVKPDAMFVEKDRPHRTTNNRNGSGIKGRKHPYIKNLHNRF